MVFAPHKILITIDGKLAFCPVVELLCVEVL